MSDCEHKDFECFCDVHRLTRGDDGPVYAYMLDVKVRCKDCQTPFTFPGFANGISSHEPRVSISEHILSVPIKPADQPHFEFFPGFDVRHTSG